LTKGHYKKAGERLLYYWETMTGTFYIAESRGRFHPMYDEESLGSYARPDQAAQDLAGGHTISILAGLNTAMLGSPTTSADGIAV
jgi:hypothetical protein